ncbi:MAG: hypothetical protein O6952_06485, partial [Planctomycetota bacterium]|nr:hypothetical protein [Planctomycetota bacterium]
TMEFCRHLSVTKAATYGIQYQLDDQSPYYRIVLPEDEFGEREFLSPKTLPKGVKLREVILPNSDRITGFGSTIVDFSPTGETGSHIVTLENEQDEIWSVKFQPLIGIASFTNGEAEFEQYRGGP